VCREIRGGWACANHPYLHLEVKLNYEGLAQPVLRVEGFLGKGASWAPMGQLMIHVRSWSTVTIKLSTFSAGENQCPRLSAEH
jgi:hypothetical protein